MMNLPLGDTAALRIVGSSANYSGWIKRRVIESGAVNNGSRHFPCRVAAEQFLLGAAAGGLERK